MKERAIILIFCLAGALRVFIFSAAFPFFSNGDEDLHFDLVTRYAAASPPRTFDVLTRTSLDFIVPYSSPEFQQTPDQFPNAQFPPPLWKQSPQEMAPVIAATEAVWKNEVNWESAQPPLYYALAGVWWNCGRTFGLNGIGALYWIRFLNVAVISILVWLGYLSARIIAPENSALRFGVPLLLAFIPQDVFYTIGNDVLSPICFGALFICALRWRQTESPTLQLGALSGLVIAASYLTKLSNVPLLAIAIIFISAKAFSILRVSARAAIALFFCAALPIIAWMWWCKTHFGGLTGSSATIAQLGWTQKNLADWFHHPIFSPRGLWTFWSELFARFWRGELNWQNRELASRAADLFYALSSLALIGAAVVGVLRNRGLSILSRRALTFCALIVLAGIAFFVLLSVQFDFGACMYPSRAHPFFTSGRLMSGALIPFALLYVYGLVFLLRPIKNAKLPLLVLITILFLVTLSEIMINRDVFASQHNWFHSL